MRYVRDRRTPNDLPEGVTYYAMEKHITEVYPDETFSFFVVEINPTALLDPEPFDDWSIPVQRRGDTFRVVDH